MMRFFVGLVAALRRDQVRHLGDRIDVGVVHIAVGVGIGVLGVEHQPALGVVLLDLAHPHAERW